MRKIIGGILLFVFLLYPARASAAVESSLKCFPATGSFKVGDTVTLDYMLDTRSNQSLGATVVATYDPSLLEAISTQSSAVLTVTNWTAPVTNSVDTTLGKITLDYGNTQTPFSGNTSLGQIQFRAKAEGQAPFTFTFFQQFDDTTPAVSKVFGKRDGTNTSNILTDVNNCIYVIETGTSTPVGTISPTPPTAATVTIISSPPVRELPRSGDFITTFQYIGSATFLISVGCISFFTRKGKK